MVCFCWPWQGRERVGCVFGHGGLSCGGEVREFENCDFPLMWVFIYVI